jgi:hypothetical protein
MEFTEQRKFSREELLGAWRAPKALFNITEDLNYATFQGQMKVFWLYAIMPILRKIEDSINIHIVWPYDRRIYFAFDIKNVPAFQEDFAGKVTTAKTLFDMGFTGNEINQKLNLGFDDKDWREFWWINSLMLPADQVMLGGMDPNNMPEDTPPADEKPKKEAPRPDMLGWGVWKSFVARQGPVERIMERKLSRYFFEQRGRILAALNEQNMRQGPDVINWENEDTILKKYIRPVMEQAVKDGVAHGQDQVGKKSSTEAITKSVDSRVVAYIEQRIAQIVGINNTTRKMLRYSIDEAISAGQTIAEIQDVVKERYNLNAMRSLRIARTETSGAVNGGSKIYYQEVGIQKNKWITAGDELVRASHRACEAQGAIKMDSAFVNGCRYPGDQEVSDPGEVVNCRCVLSPVLE